MRAHLVIFSIKLSDGIAGTRTSTPKRNRSFRYACMLGYALLSCSRSGGECEHSPLRSSNLHAHVHSGPEPKPAAQFGNFSLQAINRSLSVGSPAGSSSLESLRVYRYHGYWPGYSISQ